MKIKFKNLIKFQIFGEIQINYRFVKFKLNRMKLQSYKLWIKLLSSRIIFLSKRIKRRRKLCILKNQKCGRIRIKLKILTH